MLLTPRRGGVALALGFEGEPTGLPSARRVLNALNFHDLITVYYLSGHAIHGGTICTPSIPAFPFPNWQFADFASTDITREKPDGTHKAIHDGIGTVDDASLFDWVAKHFVDGWLTCDDGTGEVADFVHLAPDGCLSLVHVKAASSSAKSRQVSASAYEIVVAQAAKNVHYLDPINLIPRLSNPLSRARATWHDGARSTRRDFLTALSARSRAATMQVVVLQPHLTKTRYALLSGTGAASAPEDAARLARLESLVNANRGAVTGVGADLIVIAAG